MRPAVVFVGPSLGPEAVRTIAGAELLPPAAQGDVYRAALGKPFAIGLIDGFFDGVPSVWHKEILWAMSQGIHVVGGASMGALRAAELAAFGMEGEGAIYQAFRDGELQDDDEVAVAHQSDGRCYRVFSEAMVNIRATVDEALRLGVVSPYTAAVVVRAAKQTFYTERRWRSILAAVQPLVAPREREALREFLAAGHAVDQKKLDAMAVCRRVAALCFGPDRPKTVDFEFESTTAWEAAVRYCGADPHPEPSLPSAAALLDEARSNPCTFDEARNHAVTLMLVEREAIRAGLPILDDRQYHEAAEALVDAVCPGQNREQWLAGNDLEEAELRRLVNALSHRAWIDSIAELEINSRIPDQLRLAGRYPSLRTRAASKSQTLARLGRLDSVPRDFGLTDATLTQWWFATVRRTDAPADLHLAARAAGYSDEHTFLAAALREYIFRTENGAG